MAALRWGGALLVMLAVAGAAVPSARSASQAAIPRPQPGPGPASPVPEMRIAAVVNDEVISVFDLVSRLPHGLLSSNIPDSPDAARRSSLAGAACAGRRAPAIAGSEEAERHRHRRRDQYRAGQIEKQNNMQPGQLNEFLKARGIDRGSLISQLTASIEWAKLVRRKAAETVEISDEESTHAMTRVKQHASEPQSRVAEIFLAVDNPAQDAEVRSPCRKADPADEARRAVFRRLRSSSRNRRRRRSAAISAGCGPDQLPPESATAVAPLKIGELSRADPHQRRLLPGAGARPPQRRHRRRAGRYRLRRRAGRLSAAAASQRGDEAAPPPTRRTASAPPPRTARPAADRQGKGAATVERRQAQRGQRDFAARCAIC